MFHSHHRNRRLLRADLLAFALVVGSWLGAASCGDDPVEELCSATESNFSCGASQSEEQFDQAVKECQQVQEDAKDISDGCGKAHIAFLECIDSDSDCNTIDNWREDKCGAEADTVCAEEAAAFCEACPGLWFAPE